MNEKILIVDDDLCMLNLLGLLIQQRTSYQFVSTNNPLEALELIRQDVDVVIADLKMPYLDGLELLKAVKRAHKDVPVIIMAPYSTVETAAEVMREGAFDFIVKPFKREQILFSIENALKWRKLLPACVTGRRPVSSVLSAAE